MSDEIHTLADALQDEVARNLQLIVRHSRMSNGAVRIAMISADIQGAFQVVLEKDLVGMLQIHERMKLNL